MDATPEYIKMCEKAKEIQKAWEPIGGDYYLHDYHGTTGFSPDMERTIWPEDEKFFKVEILCYRPDDAKNFWVCTDGEGSHITSAQDLFKNHCVWLPRQDQLQEIWRREYLKRPGKCGWFGEFCNFMNESYSDEASADESFDTMEQLWLAFVMKEKYGKVWNGEEWA